MQVAFFTPSAVPSATPAQPPSSGEATPASFDSFLAANDAPSVGADSTSAGWSEQPTAAEPPSVDVSPNPGGDDAERWLAAAIALGMPAPAVAQPVAAPPPVAALFDANDPISDGGTAAASAEPDASPVSDVVLGAGEAAELQLGAGVALSPRGGTKTPAAPLLDARPSQSNDAAQTFSSAPGPVVAVPANQSQIPATPAAPAAPIAPAIPSAPAANSGDASSCEALPPVAPSGLSSPAGVEKPPHARPILSSKTVAARTPEIAPATATAAEPEGQEPESGATMTPVGSGAEMAAGERELERESSVAAPRAAGRGASEPASAEIDFLATPRPPEGAGAMAAPSAAAVARTSGPEALATPSVVVDSARRSPAARPPAGLSARRGATGGIQPLATSPGVQVSLVVRETAGAAATSSTNAAATNPVLTAPTLAQVLVESGAARNALPKGGATPVATAGGTFTTAAQTSEVAGAIATPAASANTQETAVVPKPAMQSGAENATAVQTSAEKLAALRGTGPQRNDGNGAGAEGRNFLDADDQGVGGGGLRSGTGIAKTAKNMSAHTLAQLPAAASLETSEVPAAVLAPAKVATVQPGRMPLTSETAGSSAIEAVRETMALAARAQEAGRNHVELRVQTADTHDLRVHLRWQDGVIQTKFVTDNSDLQQALSREWARTAPQCADKGLRFGEASFERRDQQPSDQSSAQNAFTSDQQQHSSRGQKQAFAAAEDAASSLPAAASRGNRLVSRNTSPATPISHPQNPPATAVRNLRAWA